MANISMDPRPTNYLRQNIVFSYPEMIRVSFSLFLCLSVFCYFTLLLIFIKIVLLLLLFYLFIFMKMFFFSCSGMFRNVPECSGMFRNFPCSGFYRRPIRRSFWQFVLIKVSRDLPGEHSTDWGPAEWERPFLSQWDCGLVALMNRK